MEEINRAKVFNEFFYEVLLDMEDLARNSIMIEESQDADDKMVLDFCKKLRSEVERMNKDEVFESNLIDFIQTLSPEEEEILFWEIAVVFYESWLDMLNIQNQGGETKDKVEVYSLAVASEHIVGIMDEFLGFGYFDEEPVEEDS